MYYENINGKEKKVIKTFTDANKFAAFTQKYPMPTLGNLFGLVPPTKKALTTKKTEKIPTKTTKISSSKK